MLCYNFTTNTSCYISGLNVVLPLRFREAKLGSGVLMLKIKLGKKMTFHRSLYSMHLCESIHTVIIYRLSSPSSSFL